MGLIGGAEAMNLVSFRFALSYPPAPPFKTSKIQYLPPPKYIFLLIVYQDCFKYSGKKGEPIKSRRSQSNTPYPPKEKETPPGGGE
jgi:hypothetical protein